MSVVMLTEEGRVTNNVIWSNCDSVLTLQSACWERLVRCRTNSNVCQ